MDNCWTIDLLESFTPVSKMCNNHILRVGFEFSFVTISFRFTVIVGKSPPGSTTINGFSVHMLSFPTLGNCVSWYAIAIVVLQENNASDRCDIYYGTRSELVARVVVLAGNSRNHTKNTFMCTVQKNKIK